MKKAQILSAIALAFALGVVAPVAGVNAAPVTRAGEVAEETATKADVDTAVAKIEGYAAYKKFLALNEAAQTTATLPATTTITDKITDIDANYTPATGITVQGAIDAAKALENYGKWATIIDAMDNDSTSVAEDTKRDTLIAAVKAVFPTYNAGADATFDSVKTDITNDVTTIKTQYDLYNPLVTAVNTASEALTAEADLRTALANVGKSAGEINAAADIAALKTLATTFPGYAEYATLITSVENAKKNATSDASAANKTTIETLDTNLKAATKAATGTEVSLAELATPDGTGDGTNKPDDEKDPSAPDTGILSNTEASASTTLAMVAGIATALTAAGAGVVAYRNACRANK